MEKNIKIFRKLYNVDIRVKFESIDEYELSMDEEKIYFSSILVCVRFRISTYDRQSLGIYVQVHTNFSLSILSMIWMKYEIFCFRSEFNRLLFCIYYSKIDTSNQ